MGILEQILEQNTQILALLQGGAGAPAAPAGETAAAKKKREAAEKAAAEAAAKPEFTAEELRDKYVAVQDKHGADAAKALIKEMGHEKLANLIGDTANWQQYYDAAEAKLAEDVEGDDNGGL